MHVLKAAVAVVGRSDGEVPLISCAPRFGEVLDREPALEKLGFQIEPQNDMEIVREFVCFRPDQCLLHLVDGAIEPLERCVSELVGEDALQLWKIMLPRVPAAADYVFPQP
jgi:hypothetical protein